MIKLDTDNFKCFTHTKCEFFPCHEVKDTEEFNCLFCYCPLYALGDKCGGNFSYTAKGVKNCKECNIPHKKQNYDLIMDKMSGIIDIAKKPSEKWV